MKINNLDLAKSNKDYSGMGTTFVAATIVENHVYIANVGDSRLYLVNEDIQQITKDHSLVEEMVRLGQLGNRKKPELILIKNIITRAVGAEEAVDSRLFLRLQTTAK